MVGTGSSWPLPLKLHSGLHKVLSGYTQSLRLSSPLGSIGVGVSAVLIMPPNGLSLGLSAFLGGLLPWLLSRCGTVFPREDTWVEASVPIMRPYQGHRPSLSSLFHTLAAK